MADEEEIDTFNFAMVGVRGETIVVLRPQMVAQMTKQQARLLAAYLVILADEPPFELPAKENNPLIKESAFLRTLRAVSET